MRWPLLALGLFTATSRADDVARVTVHVPVGATLTIDGKPTEQMTGVRQFESPPLKPGYLYPYTFRAEFTWNGQPVVVQKRVKVQPGELVVVDLNDGPPPPKAEPKPEPPPRPKPVPPPVVVVPKLVKPPARESVPAPRPVVPPAPKREPAPMPNPGPAPFELAPPPRRPGEPRA